MVLDNDDQLNRSTDSNHSDPESSSGSDSSLSGSSSSSSSDNDNPGIIIIPIPIFSPSSSSSSSDDILEDDEEETSSSSSESESDDDDEEKDSKQRFADLVKRFNLHIQNRQNQNGLRPSRPLRRKKKKKPTIPLEDREKVDIVENIKTLDDMLYVIDKYENKPELYYSIDIEKLKALKQPLLELKNLVGLEKIKSQVLDQIKFLLSGFDDDDQMLHTMITGAPGCGKTTTAIILAKIYQALGYSNGNFRIVKRSDLVAGYLGQTAMKTQKIFNEMRGGVIFIDEVYSLGNKGGGDSFAKEAIDTINQNLTEMKREIVCIIAGYEKQIEECFFSYNPGLSRRFPFRYKIGDYNDRNLHAIFRKKILDSGWTCDEIPISFFAENFKYFKNRGGDMENLSQTTKMAYCRRTFGRHMETKKHLIAQDVYEGIALFLKKYNLKKEFPKLEVNPDGEFIDLSDKITNIRDMLTAIDNCQDDPNKNYPFDINKFKALKKPLTTLNNMVGLEDIKSQVLVQIMYLLSNLQDENMMLHTVLCGKPGCGKTMLAQILAEIYQVLGYSNGNFKIAKGSDLVAGYVGQTALKTQELIDESKGGVLFIDEAYSISPENPTDKSFAKEALDTLNQNLTELKTDFICIIAGYKDKLEKSFFSYNPGLNRRFPFRYELSDYKAKDLKNIFEYKVRESQWKHDELPLSFFEKNFKFFTNRGGDMETLLQMCKIVYARKTFGSHQFDRKKTITYKHLVEALELFKKGRSTSLEDTHDKFFKTRVKNSMYM